MGRRSTEILASGLLAFAAGYVLWPPRHVYWVQVSQAIGELAALAIVGISAVLVGG
ncbi:hypothetical protein [Natrinema caseinilyticum]|uniref:hypothetical protein n=1 Tax=Natrinema caseinilyticum TaxID=2961570 RepID=UPI0020C22B0C|nr:hypothetical protein [Natrinema caseinilyticum]